MSGTAAVCQVYQVYQRCGPCVVFDKRLSKTKSVLLDGFAFISSLCSKEQTTDLQENTIYLVCLQTEFSMHQTILRSK